MNAAEQAKSLDAASKIAAIVNLFKSEFPDLRSDLKPWANDPYTRQQMDPDSIDIGFHFPGFARSLQSRSLLVQIRFYEDPETQTRRAIGAEMAGFDHSGKRWRMSTVNNWEFEGSLTPNRDASNKLRSVLRRVLELCS